MSQTTSAARAGAGDPCLRRAEGCTGVYGPEGYCEECGRRAPTRRTAAFVAAAEAAAVVGTGSRTGSGRGSGPASGSGSGPGSGSGTAGRTSGRSRSSGRTGLGAGLVEFPRMPVPDPTRVVLVDPRVPENRRFCGKCEYPVGRSRDGNPGLVEGFCPQDGTRFSFVPKLHAQDVVGERYEVIGCLAYGGLGWIYLARDKNLGGRGQ